LNHLLNFSLPPRQNPTFIRTKRRGVGPSEHYNHERFVNAKYASQFSCKNFFPFFFSPFFFWGRFHTMSNPIYIYKILSSCFRSYYFFSYRFVLKNDGDYSVYLVDSNALVDWNQVVEVVSDSFLPSPLFLAIIVNNIYAGRKGHMREIFSLFHSQLTIDYSDI